MAFNAKAASGRAPSKITLPTKRTVNFAEVGKKKTKLGIAIPGIILIVIAAFLFSKFAVIDRLVKVSEAERAVSEVRAKIVAGNQKIDSFGELTDIYAHYTFSGMTEEELNRTGRVKIIDLVRNVILPEAYVESFSISGNVMTVSVTDDTLRSINLIAEKLEKEPIVSFCTVTTAATNDRDLDLRRAIEEKGLVTANLNIYLVGELETEEEETN